MNISQNIKAIIFDVDGLMIDSTPTWIKTHSQFLDKYNIVLDEKSGKDMHGIGLKQLIEKLHDKFSLQKSADELLSEYREIFYKNFSAPHPMQMLEGVEEIVRYFFEKGFQLAIATGGHTEIEMKEMLTAFNLLKYFEVIVSGDEVEKGKPAPDVFLLAAKKLGRKPFECLVLEDSVNGVLAAKAAGMSVYGVNKDSNYFKDLEEAGVDKVFYSLSELL